MKTKILRLLWQGRRLHSFELHSWLLCDPGMREGLDHDHGLGQEKWRASNMIAPPILVIDSNLIWLTKYIWNMKKEERLVIKKYIKIISFSRWSIGGGFNSVQSLGKSYVSTIIIADVNITAVLSYCALLANLAIEHTLKNFGGVLAFLTIF